MSKIFKQRRLRLGSSPYIFPVVVFVPFFLPSGFEYSDGYTFVRSLFYIWQMFGVALLAIYAISKLLLMRITYPLLALIAMTAVMIYSTHHFGYPIENVLTTWCAYCFYAIGSYFYCQNNLHTYIHVMRNWLVALGVVNLLSMVIYPEGIPGVVNNFVNFNIANYVWLWGFKNSMGSMLLPMLAFTCAADKIAGKKFSLWQLTAIVVMVATSFLASSSTLMVVAVLLLAGQFVFFYLRMPFLVNIRAAFILWVTLDFAVVIFNVQNYFSGILEDLFDKDATLSARVIIWQLSIEYIERSPLIGLGVQGSEYLLQYYNLAFSHSHNALVTIAFCGGLLSLFLFLVYVWGACSPLYKYRYDYHAMLLTIILFGYFVTSITGSFLSVGLLSILSLAIVYEKCMAVSTCSYTMV